MTILGARPFTRYRRIAGTTSSAGIYVPGAETSSTQSGSIQVATDEDLIVLPEGLRSRDPRIILTTASLRVADPSTGLPGDEVTWPEVTERYIVAAVGRTYDLLPHYRALVVRVPEAVNG
jgi:hypothetical protein